MGDWMMMMMIDGRSRKTKTKNQTIGEAVSLRGQQEHTPRPTDGNEEGLRKSSPLMSPDKPACFGG
jgi:hypothetical protein